MGFNKLSITGNHYRVNRKVPFQAQVDLEKYLSGVFEFAYGMTFGKSGHHRTHRTGGQYGRKNGELFINAFQGKLAEFGVWELLKSKGLHTPKPDLEKWGEGIWDDSDLKTGNKHISIKSTSNIGNLLLLESDDWDSQGKYVPNLVNGNATVDCHLFTRVSPDGKKLMRSKKWMYLDEIDQHSLYALIKGTNWMFDAPGFITEDHLKRLISHGFIIPQNAMLNGWMKMNASNYYCQAGDLKSINELIIFLS